MTQRRYKLVPCKNNEFAIVDTSRMMAKAGDEYSVSITGTILLVDNTKLVLWQNGCSPVIAASYQVGDLPLIAHNKSELLFMYMKHVSSDFIEVAMHGETKLYTGVELGKILDAYQVECQLKYNEGTVPDAREWFIGKYLPVFFTTFFPSRDKENNGIYCWIEENLCEETCELADCKIRGCLNPLSGDTPRLTADGKIKILKLL